MKAKFASTLFCECNRGFEHVGSEYVRCINPACPCFGKKFALPHIELVEIVPVQATAADLGLDLSLAHSVSVAGLTAINENDVGTITAGTLEKPV